MVKLFSGIWVTLMGILILIFGRGLGDSPFGIVGVIATGLPTMAVGVWMMLGANLKASASKQEKPAQAVENAPT